MYLSRQSTKTPKEFKGSISLLNPQGWGGEIVKGQNSRWMFPKIGLGTQKIPKMDGLYWKTIFEMDDLGVALFLETPTCKSKKSTPSFMERQTSSRKTCFGKHQQFCKGMHTNIFQAGSFVWLNTHEQSTCKFDAQHQVLDVRLEFLLVYLCFA